MAATLHTLCDRCVEVWAPPRVHRLKPALPCCLCTAPASQTVGSDEPMRLWHPAGTLWEDTHPAGLG